ncbi:MAG: FtsK/SpoIIIE domain-containing protein [Actinomycetota bacterium]|nr:FtsK/SpoIIIE domain-containing protein [Actinomycetota bacterium]
MHFVFDDGIEARDVDVVVHDPDALVADLVVSLSDLCGRGGLLVVDGRLVPGERRLDRAGIPEGAAVRLERSHDGRSVAGREEAAQHHLGRSAVAVVEVVGGLHAGQRRLLAPGRWSIGRIGTDVVIDDPTVSFTHSSVDVAPNGTIGLVDRHSLNGTWVADVAVEGPATIKPGAIIRLGASQLQICPVAAEDTSVPAAVPAATGWRFGTGGASPFNRPPRLMPITEHEPLDPPQAPAEVARTMSAGVISVIAPLVFGLVMVKVFHNWLYGMFVLLSPVMLLGNAVESRRRDRRTRRRDRLRFAREVSDFRTRLSELAAAERDRLCERLPTPPEILRRSTAPSTRLWERRPGHEDFLNLRAGLGAVRWDPPVDGIRRALDEEVRHAITDASTLADTPVAVDLADGGIVGIVGPRPAALALARSLVAQAVTLHGPADLPVAVLTASERARDWDWTKWLPHTLDPTGSDRQMLAADPERADELMRGLLARAPAQAGPPDRATPAAGPTLLLVLDDESLTEGRRSPARSVLRGVAGAVAGIVIAATEDRLPAMCTTIIEITDDHGEALVHRPETGEQDGQVLLAGMAEPAVRMIARALARFEDPEHDVVGAGLPAEVSLLPLLDLDTPLIEAISRRWETSGPDPDTVAPIGVTQDGVLALDLVRDGPHGLIAGTTGSGKSELLRSLVAGLAAGCSPDHLTFVLIDFKGGSAFDQCARLPHTVGMVTDLDERLGARALRCLEAELRHRERCLRAAGVGDVKEYRRLTSEPAPMPRLVVVIDEFATLKNELPDFVDALVGIAQRGRSLGVHLVLATQRPSGAVSENIRANTDLRIALRVQDANDSHDVIGLPDAASIGRHQPGRAWARLGPGEVVAVQTALATGIASAEGVPPVEVRPFRFASLTLTSRSDNGPTGPQGSSPAAERPRSTDLSRLVDAIRAAFDASGRPAPRRPWPEPLAARVSLDALVAEGPVTPFGGPGAVLAFALADLPDLQVQRPTGWVPADGNLLLVGVGGSGTTTALSSIALTAARATGPDDLHLYVVDFGAGELAPLAHLPHTGAVITTDQRERQTRLMRHLKAELSRRRALPDPRRSEARILVLLDGLAGFRAAWDDAEGTAMFDDLVRVFADGTEVGIHLALTVDRPGAVPNAISALADQRLIFRLGESLDYNIFGLAARDVPDLTPGEAVVPGSGTRIRIGLPQPDLPAAVAGVIASSGPAAARPAAEVGQLPDHVEPSDLVTTALLGRSPWCLPIGVSEATLGPVGLTLYDGEHALIAGPPRSGRTTAVRTLAHVARRASPSLTIVGIAGARSTLRFAPELDLVLGQDADRLAIDALGDLTGPVLVLVDDADLFDDEHASMQALLDRRRPDLHIVATGRSEALRSLYTHWTRSVRASRSGLLLQPDADLDGDLFGTRLPRRAPVALTSGRGYLVTGSQLEIVQVARQV